MTWSLNHHKWCLTCYVALIVLGFVGGVAAATYNAYMRAQNPAGHWTALSVDANGNLQVVFQ